jgi:hypothetical protein
VCLESLALALSVSVSVSVYVYVYACIYIPGVYAHLTGGTFSWAKAPNADVWGRMLTYADVC